METLDYVDSAKNIPSSNWDPAITPVTSFDAGRMGFERDLNLCLIEQKETHTDRPLIPATMHEKLAYYRSYASSPSKTQIICMQQVKFTRYLWFHITNVFCKSLPNTYVYMFLSNYAPDHHMFLPKMVPIAYGFNWALIISAFIYLLLYTEFVILLLDYVICGIIHKNPWNRCPFEFMLTKNRTILCYTLDEFTSMQNITPYMPKGVYLSPANESLLLAPIAYYKFRFTQVRKVHFYFIFLWTLAVLHYKQLFKRHIWKVLNRTQMLLNIIYILSFGHIVTLQLKNGFKSIFVSYEESLSHFLWDADLELLSESMTAPPIVHVISSRSVTKVDPDRDSTMMIISNSVYYILRGFLSYKLKQHCENIVNAPLLISTLNTNNILYLWPIYFSYFYLGDFYTVIFFALTFLTEYVTIIITIQCLIEVIVCEWKWAKRVSVSAFLCIAGILLKFISRINHMLVLYVFSMSVVTLAEVLVIYCMYPLGRLVDDITFYSGTSPTKFRVFNFRIVPIFYTIKIYEMYKGFFQVFDKIKLNIRLPYYMFALYGVYVPFVIGAVYACWVCIFVKKQKIASLLKPISDWGPKDPASRQLRKLYDSRNYVGSQAVRELSRYMILKSRLESYKLDVIYDNLGRPSSQALATVHTVDEKKHK